MTSAIREKTLHSLFLISVWLKGGAGMLETLAGVPFFFVTPRAIEDFVVLLTALELSEDPNDWIATTIRRAVHHFSADTGLFVSVYLVIHGLIKIFLSLAWNPQNIIRPRVNRPLRHCQTDEINRDKNDYICSLATHED
jgi:uncharacterized membrane protein